MNQDLITKDAAPHINITPLIDVLLVLLIIFMVVSPLKPARFQAAIPSEPKPPENITPNPYTLIVAINRDLQLSLNNRNELGSVNESGALSAELVRIFRERRENGAFRDDAIGRTDLSDDEKTVKNVFIKAPRTIAYGDVIKVMDAIKGAGAAPIGLQIDDLRD